MKRRDIPGLLIYYIDLVTYPHTNPALRTCDTAIVLRMLTRKAKILLLTSLRVSYWSLDLHRGALEMMKDVMVWMMGEVSGSFVAISRVTFNDSWDCYERSQAKPST
jgi:hypothetical protein